MIINGASLLMARPIKDMIGEKVKVHGRSYGLSEVGYDFRMKQRIRFFPPNAFTALVMTKSVKRASDFTLEAREAYEKAVHGYTVVTEDDGTETIKIGRTALASSVEEFHIPNNLWCEFRNKSTNARHHIDAALGADGEPGWNGFLTIEIIFNGMVDVDLPAGVPILKAVFHEITEKAAYQGKYQDQPDRPVSAIHE